MGKKLNFKKKSKAGAKNDDEKKGKYEKIIEEYEQDYDNDSLVHSIGDDEISLEEDQSILGIIPPILNPFSDPIV